MLQYCGPLGSSSAADYFAQHKVVNHHILWSVSEVVYGQCSKVAINSCCLHIQQSSSARVDGVKSTGELNKHDPYSVSQGLRVKDVSVQKV